jgi:hypothetical protein
VPELRLPGQQTYAFDPYGLPMQRLPGSGVGSAGSHAGSSSDHKFEPVIDSGIESGNMLARVVRRNCRFLPAVPAFSKSG